MNTETVDKREDKDFVSSSAEITAYYRTSIPYRDMLAGRPGSDFARFLDLVNRNVAPESTILEIGAGTGQVASHLLAQGYQVVASDLSSAFLEQGRDSTPSLICVATAVTKLPFSSSTFQATISNETLEHLVDIPACLNEMIRVTAVGGLIIIRGPALTSPIWPIIDLPNLLSGKGGRPPHYRTLSEACRFLVVNVIRTAKIGISPNPTFHERTPDLSGNADTIGGDCDATYWSSAIEVARFLEGAGLEVLSLVEAGPPFSRSWWVAKVAPWLSPTVAIVARRRRAKRKRIPLR